MSHSIVDQHRYKMSHTIGDNHKVTVNIIDQSRLSHKKGDQYNVFYNGCDQYRVKRVMWQNYIMQFRHVPSQEMWGKVQRCILYQCGRRWYKDNAEDEKRKLNISKGQIFCRENYEEREILHYITDNTNNQH